MSIVQSGGVATSHKLHCMQTILVFFVGSEEVV